MQAQAATQLPRSLATPSARERVDWAAALGAGFVAGTTLLLCLLVLAVALYDEAPWKLLRMMAATVTGEGALATDAFDLPLVGLGLAMHFSLSLLYALALAGLVADVRRWLVPWIGLGFGVALYFTNLYGFTHLFGWFAELRTVDTLLVHALFGLLLARAYCVFTEPRA